MEDHTLDPATTALLVMDYQPAVLARLPDPDAQVARAAAAIDVVRRHGAHVGYVRVGLSAKEAASAPAHSRFATLGADEAMRPDAPGTQVAEALAPGADDVVVRKTRVGAFSTTALDDQLRARGVDTVVLAGISTSGVTLSTVRDASDRDYRVLVLSDATADPDPEVHDFLLTRVFPGQAEVLTTAELGSRFA